MRKLNISILVFFMLIITNLFAEELPRIAVIPFNSINVSEGDAKTVSTLFEVALVKTTAFTVIEQNQMQEIMEAQALTLTGCTDDSCAIEVGQLLAAEQIIIGNLSRVGDSYTLSAKIIDIATGENINADTVTTESISEFPKISELLAYKLAGMTGMRGDELVIIENFGELLVFTNPEGAEIYINGMKKGAAPDLFTHIPFGTVQVEARKGALYATKYVEITGVSTELELMLKGDVTGQLFIKGCDRDVSIYLDDTELGIIGSGSFRDLIAGPHLLRLQGKGYFWEEKITIEDGKTTALEVFPKLYGRINYSLPEGAEAIITGKDYKKIVTGTGVLDLVWTGIYNISVHGEDYLAYDEEITIERNSDIYFSKKLAYSLIGATNAYRTRLKELEMLIGVSLFDEQIAEVDDILNSMNASGYQLDDLYALANSIKIAIIQNEVSLLEERYQSFEQGRMNNNIISLLFGGSGVLALSGMGTTIYFADQAYQNYTGALTTADSIYYHNQTEILDWGTIGTAVLGGISVIGSIIFALQPDYATPVLERINKLKIEIEILEGSGE